MFGSAILDSVIGIVFVFLTLSIVVSACSEQFSNKAGLRGKILKLCVARLLAGGTRADIKSISCIKPKGQGWFTRLFFGLDEILEHERFNEHELIRALKQSDGSYPSYIPADTFAEVIIDLLIAKHREGKAVLAAEKEMAYLHKCLEPDYQEDDPCFSPSVIRSIKAMLAKAENTSGEAANTAVSRLKAFKTELGNWFESTGTRSSGWYKKAVNRCTVITAIVVVCMINIDSIVLFQNIYHQPEVRSGLTEVAANLYSSANLQNADQADIESAKAYLKEINKVGLPIGWSERLAVNAEKERKGMDLFQMFLGWLVTILAVSLGAPFWFDLLNKLVNLRSGGKPDTLIPQTASEQQQAGPVGAGASVGASPTTPSATGGSVAAIKKEPVSLPEGFWRQDERAGEFRSIMDQGDSDEIRERQMLVLAEAAGMAYMAPDSIRGIAERNWLGGSADDNNFRFYGQGTTQAFMARNGSNMILSFRGTEMKMEDFLADARFIMKPFASGGKVGGKTHEGFTDALALVYDQIADTIRDFQERDRNLRLFLTGHSLGAALATLCAARFINDDLAGCLNLMATFGSPRCGDQTFVNGIKANTDDNIFRFINNEDLVTRVPPRSMGFRHIGETRYFDENGELTNLNGWVRFLKTRIHTGRSQTRLCVLNSRSLRCEVASQEPEREHEIWHLLVGSQDRTQFLFQLLPQPSCVLSEERFQTMAPCQTAPFHLRDVHGAGCLHTIKHASRE